MPKALNRRLRIHPASNHTAIARMIIRMVRLGRKRANEKARSALLNAVAVHRNDLAVISECFDDLGIAEAAESPAKAVADLDADLRILSVIDPDARPH